MSVDSLFPLCAFGAAILFAQFQSASKYIWFYREPGTHWMQNRVVSFLIAIVIVRLAYANLVVSTAILMLELIPVMEWIMTQRAEMEQKKKGAFPVGVALDAYSKHLNVILLALGTSYCDKKELRIEVIRARWDALKGSVDRLFEKREEEGERGIEKLGRYTITVRDDKITIRTVLPAAGEWSEVRMPYADIERLRKMLTSYALNLNTEETCAFYMDVQRIIWPMERFTAPVGAEIPAEFPSKPRASDVLPMATPQPVPSPPRAPNVHPVPSPARTFDAQFMVEFEEMARLAAEGLPVSAAPGDVAIAGPYI